MRTSLASVLTLSLLCTASSAFAQDEMGGDPEAGDVGGEAEFGGDGGMLAGDAGGGGGGPAKPISAALMLGYGISLEDGPNPWGFGFGLRGGYNLDKIFLGVRFLYWFGESEEVTIPFAGTVETTFKLWELGIEGGYDLAVADKLTVRPGLGLGLAFATFETGGASETESEFFLAPGVSGLYDVSEDIFVGADARVQFVLSDPGIEAITLLATGGMRF